MPQYPQKIVFLFLAVGPVIYQHYIELRSSLNTKTTNGSILGIYINHDMLIVWLNSDFEITINCIIKGFEICHNSTFL